MKICSSSARPSAVEFKAIPLMEIWKENNQCSVRGDNHSKSPLCHNNNIIYYSCSDCSGFKDRIKFQVSKPSVSNVQEVFTASAGNVHTRN